MLECRIKENDHNAALNASSCKNDNEPKCFEPGGNIRQNSDTNRDLKSFKEERRDEMNSLKPNSSTYLLTRAYQVLRNQNITCDTKLRCSIVKQPKEVARMVIIFPKVNCSRQPTEECYHIIAAME